MTARTTVIVGLLTLALGAAWWCAWLGEASVDEVLSAPLAHAAERADDGRSMSLDGRDGDELLSPRERLPRLARVEPLDLDAVLGSDAWGREGASADRVLERAGSSPRGDRPAAARRVAAEPEFPSVAELPAVAEGLVDQAHTGSLLGVLYQLGGAVLPDSEDDPARTRFQTRPELVVPLVERALEASSGVARQSLILHLALALPLREAREHLQPLLDGDDPDDAEDALCTLAFLGDARALVAFEQLARQPAPVDVRQSWDRDDVKDLARRGKRAVLRSYRCVEALRRRPYFHMDGLAYDGMRRRFPWAAPGETSDDASVRLLEAWLRRYPGHAGADNACYRLAQLHLAAGRQVETSYAASRGAGEPDGDANDRCLHLLIALMEHADLRSDVLARRIDERAPRRNADLLHYIWVRRLADELGPQAGLDELARIAQGSPRLDVASAWRRRWCARPLEGLDSGVRALAHDDPLRRVESVTEGATYGEYRVGHWGWRRPPSVESDMGKAIQLGGFRLSRQFRAWETLAELQRRAELAPYEERVDLLYKQAALHYHEREVFYPVYAVHDRYSSGRADGLVDYDDVPRDPPPVLRYAPDFALGRAIAGFERVLREGPAHALADDALFSVGMAHVKLASRRTVRHDPARRRAHLSTGVQAFERLAREFPLSTLADDGARAAAHWRGLGYGDP